MQFDCHFIRILCLLCIAAIVSACNPPDKSTLATYQTGSGPTIALPLELIQAAQLERGSVQAFVIVNDKRNTMTFNTKEVYGKIDGLIPGDVRIQVLFEFTQADSDQPPIAIAMAEDRFELKPGANNLIIKTGDFSFRFDKDGDTLNNLDEVLLGYDPYVIQPVFTGPATFSVSENTVDDVVVSAQAPKPDINLIYSIEDGLDGNMMTIDSHSGAVHFKQAQDFENPMDENHDGIYEFVVRATDGFASNSRSVTIQLKNQFDFTVSGYESHLQFLWDSNGAAYYKLFESLNNQQSFEQVNKTNINTTQFIKDISVHLFPWQQAYYRLESYDNTGTLLDTSEVVPAAPAMLDSTTKLFTKKQASFSTSTISEIGMSADGSTLAIGVLKDDSPAKGINPPLNEINTTGAAEAGAVYVYAKDGSGLWQFQAYIKASNTDPGDRFGKAVALSLDGNTLAVGAPREHSAGTGIDPTGFGEDDNSAGEVGAVYLYERSGGIWNKTAYIKPTSINTTYLYQGFGGSLALSDDAGTLAVGERYLNRATILTRDTAGIWQKPTVIERKTHDGFADIVRLSADASTLVVDYYDNFWTQSGVFVFSKDLNWGEQAKFSSENFDENDNFARHFVLSKDGNILAVSAYSEDSSVSEIKQNAIGAIDNTLTDAGAVYVYSRNNGIWTRQAYIKPSNPDSEDEFGRSLGLSRDGKTLLVGSPFEDSRANGVDDTVYGKDDNSQVNSGAIYMFTYSGTWTQQHYIKASQYFIGMNFGYHLAINADNTELAAGSFYYVTGEPVFIY